MSIINRVATANMYDNSIRNIGGRQSSLAEQSEKLTAGKRVLRASDDPVAAAQAERAITRMERIKVEQSALSLQRNAMAEGESTLGDAVDLLQEMRALFVSAGNGANSAKEMQIIAGQLQTLREELLSVSNRTNTSGVPLLSALGSAITPFVNSSAFKDNGLPGQQAGSNTSIPTALDGDMAFMLDSGESLFKELDTAITGIRNATSGSAANQSSVIQNGLANIDQGMDRLSALRGFAGDMLNRADRITGDQEVRSIQLEADRSRAEDMDLVKGFSDFEQTKMGYQAALQTYAMVQKMSLFNYIS
ncbi:MAG: flagellar hook-associated protein 3 [Giesbergeria sp.]|nr:flagellar hook-associated protein 3 [Giesbergeria sp.]MBP6320637.1 flagellar hook-associated protein 3 [Giesbergeria sp.]MBP7916756.1 flagellar hook-associated protein 3 [Giesbergeria sp.]